MTSVQVTILLLELVPAVTTAIYCQPDPAKNTILFARQLILPEAALLASRAIFFSRVHAPRLAIWLVCTFTMPSVALRNWLLLRMEPPCHEVMMIYNQQF